MPGLLLVVLVLWAAIAAEYDMGPGEAVGLAAKLGDADEVRPGGTVPTAPTLPGIGVVLGIVLAIVVTGGGVLLPAVLIALALLVVLVLLVLVSPAARVVDLLKARLCNTYIHRNRHYTGIIHLKTEYN